MVLEHGIGVQLLFDDKFGSVLICIGKPKVSVGGGEWAWLSPLSLLYFYCNLICELLHVLNLTTPGHTTIFELAQLFDPILCG